MNDAQEIHTLRAPLVDGLEKRLIPVVTRARRQLSPPKSAVWRRDAPQHLARVWGNALYRVVFADDEAERTAFCCTASFCSHVSDKPYEREHGLLSQWRGYGADGGYCLVFDTAGMWKLFEQERETFFYPYADVREAFYPRETSQQLECFTELLNTSKAVIGTALGNGDFSVDQTLLPFVSSATAFKHQGFYEEREVRLVAMAGTELAAEMERKAGRNPAPLKVVSMTSRDGRERRHISLFGKHFAPLPLQRVIVGPSQCKTRTRRLRKRSSAEIFGSQSRQHRTLAECRRRRAARTGPSRDANKSGCDDSVFVPLCASFVPWNFCQRLVISVGSRLTLWEHKRSCCKPWKGIEKNGKGRQGGLSI